MKRRDTMGDVVGLFGESLVETPRGLKPAARNRKKRHALARSLSRRSVRMLRSLKHSMTSSNGVAVALLLAVSVPAATLAQTPSAIVAGRYVAPDGSLQDGTALVLASGKIKSVRAEAKLNVKGEVVRHPSGVLCPGLLDVRSVIGAYGRNQETMSAIDPGASAIDVVDRSHRDFRSAVRAGITTVMIAPAPTNLVSGAAVVVKTASPDGSATILRSDGPLAFALGGGVLHPSRMPTSRLGAVGMLRDLLGRAQQGNAHQRLVDFVGGKLDAVVYCEDAADLDAALRTFQRGTYSIVHTGDVHEQAIHLEARRRPIVIGPYGFHTPPRTLATAGAFSAAGVPVAFAGDMPRHSGDALRLTAALAVRYGMDPAAARLAMTAVPAKVAGVDDRVGSIRPGLDADLVIFSDDPLRPDAYVVEVYIDGVRVYGADRASGEPK